MIPFFRKYFGKIYIPIIWTLFIGILLTLPGSVLPSETKFSIPQFDKLVHMSMFGGFVFLWNLYLSNRSINSSNTAGNNLANPARSIARLLRSFFLIFILAVAYGVSSEYIQGCCIPLRDFDLADIIADMSGAGLAYGFSNLFLLPVDKG
jgi:hypothetical protein